MGATYTDVTISALNGRKKSFKAKFLVDTGATDTIAPAGDLKKIGIKKIGSESYELADGRVVTMDFGLAQIMVMDRITAGRVIFGPDNVEPLLGVAVLESIAVKINPVTRQLEKLPTGMLK